LGKLAINVEQGKALGLTPGQLMSPYLEKCCLLVSANVSYANAEQDMAVLTGINVSAKTQQRLVQGHSFEVMQPHVPIEELAVDGGTVRLRTPLGQPCEWRHYKAVATDQGTLAGFGNNPGLIEQVNRFPLSTPVTCLGDGHDGIWNIVEKIATKEQRREILDWYHLKENLYKIPLNEKRLKKVESCLWKGNVEGALALLDKSRQSQAQNFCAYVRKHQTRIVNYDYYQAEGISSIGSGRVESAIKQINRRIQISGAQWRQDNVPQVLAHRAAYLNGFFSRKG
jgi:hypothetical protein